MPFSKARWRKATDINRKYAIFELVHEENILLDIWFSDNGALEVSFHRGISNTAVNWDQFTNVIADGMRIAESDK
ncbi:hypothetical protein MKL09_31900 [Methylobacterium sp. J-048]|uniref:hypothetical protein n=1 Tax=Methylobacterium sp. J-048 TaxID=2836635 RepID=UPI001FB897A1|nr:hypothetical protein [Methylobacterium sp. J-048]MCJ2061110.1 hypothetical protein [Methylobacterium sp. J-048]